MTETIKKLLRLFYCLKNIQHIIFNLRKSVIFIKKSSNASYFSWFLCTIRCPLHGNFDQDMKMEVWKTWITSLKSIFVPEIDIHKIKKALRVAPTARTRFIHDFTRKRYGGDERHLHPGVPSPSPLRPSPSPAIPRLLSGRLLAAPPIPQERTISARSPYRASREMMLRWCIESTQEANVKIAGIVSTNIYAEPQTVD